MNKENKVSFWTNVLEKVNMATDENELRLMLAKYTRESNINDNDKRKIMLDLEHRLNGVVNIQKYVYNSYLKFTGMGVIGAKR